MQSAQAPRQRTKRAAPHRMYSSVLCTRTSLNMLKHCMLTTCSRALDKPCECTACSMATAILIVPSCSCEKGNEVQAGQGGIVFSLSLSLYLNMLFSSEGLPFSSLQELVRPNILLDLKLLRHGVRCTSFQVLSDPCNLTSPYETRNQLKVL